MSALSNIARSPAIAVPRDATVLDAVHSMLKHRIGAVLVLESDRPEGIFTAHDLLLKVVPESRDPKTTPLSAVMSSPVATVRSDATAPLALREMVKRGIQHLPVVDDAGRVVGMLSMRHLLRDRIDGLKGELGALANYAGADGIGG